MTALPQNLSKSKLVAFRQCPKRLWLEVHRKELRTDSAGTQAGFVVGFQVGEIAKQIYDQSGSAALIDVEAEGFEEAFARSALLLSTSSNAVFEAGFQANGALAFADVMLPIARDGITSWKMVEVKSSTKIKDYHHDDIAIQTFVARASGVNLESVALAHIDNSWVYPGGGDYRGLLKEIDMSAEAFSRTAEVEGWIREAHAVVAQTTEPDVSIGDHCYTPFECGFCAYCSPPVPGPEFPLEWLPRFSAARREALTDQGIDDLRHVPDDALNETQQKVKLHSLNGSVYFDAPGAAADLAGYGFPAYFLDFESIQFAVPIWAGTRPYQQIVFQFSLHILDDGLNLTHRAFLDLSGGDPSRPLATTLIEACGNTDPIFVYNAAFERTRISELAERFPDLRAELHAINARIVDLLPIARNRFYHPSQQGSWSIKKVLPAVVPNLRYDSLQGVRDGDMAMAAFVEALTPSTTSARKAEIEEELLAYCELDTYAMVRLWEVFSGRKPLEP